MRVRVRVRVRVCIVDARVVAAVAQFVWHMPISGTTRRILECL